MKKNKNVISGITLSMVLTFIFTVFSLFKCTDSLGNVFAFPNCQHIAKKGNKTTLKVKKTKTSKINH